MDTKTDKIFAFLGRILVAVSLLLLVGWVLKLVLGLPGAGFDPLQSLLTAGVLYLLWQVYSQQKRQTELLTRLLLEQTSKELEKASSNGALPASSKPKSKSKIDKLDTSL